MQYDLTWSSDALNRWPCTLLFHDRPYLSVQLSKQVLQDMVSRNSLCDWSSKILATRPRSDQVPYPSFVCPLRTSSGLHSSAESVDSDREGTTLSDWLPTAPHPVDSLIQYPPPPHPILNYTKPFRRLNQEDSRYSSCSIIFTCTALSNPIFFTVKFHWATSQGGSFTWSRRMFGVVKYEYISWRGLCCNDKRTLGHIASPAQ